MLSASLRKVSSSPLLRRSLLKSRWTFAKSLSTGTTNTNGHVEFDTLHEMQSRSCDVFAERELFGTFTNDKFEFITYAEFDAQVQTARTMLVDLGESFDTVRHTVSSDSLTNTLSRFF